MKRLLFLGIIILFLASCAQSQSATPAARVDNANVTPQIIVPTSTREGPLPTQPVPSRIVPTVVGLGAPTPARIQIEPRASDGERVGSESELFDIVLYDVTGLYGVELHLSFDASTVKVEDSNPDLPGTQLVAGDAFPKGSSFVAVNWADQVQGKLDFAATRLSPALALDGRVVVASFEVSALQAGTTMIEFSQVLLSDIAAQSLPVEAEGIEIVTEL